MILVLILAALLGFGPAMLAFWHLHTIISILLLLFFV